MAPRKRTSADGAAEALGKVEAIRLNFPDATSQAPRQLIDRYGHVHSEAVLANWSPQALKAFGIHPVGDRDE
jgi:hypothetical protein